MGTKGSWRRPGLSILLQGIGDDSRVAHANRARRVRKRWWSPPRYCRHWVCRLRAQRDRLPQAAGAPPAPPSRAGQTRSTTTCARRCPCGAGAIRAWKSSGRGHGLHRQWPQRANMPTSASACLEPAGTPQPRCSSMAKAMTLRGRTSCASSRTSSMAVDNKRWIGACVGIKIIAVKLAYKAVSPISFK